MPAFELTWGWSRRLISTAQAASKLKEASKHPSFQVFKAALSRVFCTLCNIAKPVRSRHKIHGASILFRTSVPPSAVLQLLMVEPGVCCPSSPGLAMPTARHRENDPIGYCRFVRDAVRLIARGFAHRLAACCCVAVQVEIAQCMREACSDQKAITRAD